MLPLSAAEIIEFHPASARVDEANAALEKAKAAPEPNPIVIDAAEALLTEAEAARDKADPVYRLRVPTIRSKSAAGRDLMSEGVTLKTNAELIAVLSEARDEIGPEDEAFLQGLSISIAEDGSMLPEDWGHLHDIARSVPAGARIIADRIYYRTVSRLHTIRHHLIIDGQRSPLSERAIDALPPEDVVAIASKIESLITPSVDETKNSDAP